MANGNSKRRNIVLAEAVKSGQTAVAEKTMTTADKQREVHQAHLEFVTELVNGGVKDSGIDWLDNNRYVDVLVKLAEVRGLKVTHDMLKERFAKQGLVDTNKELEGAESDSINQPLTTHSRLMQGGF